MASVVSAGVNALDLVVGFVSPSTTCFQKSLGEDMPNSIDGFRRRVESFTTFRWLTHAPSVSPLECARWGWECVETDLLRCVSCRSFLYGRNDNLLTNKESDSKLKEALSQSHKSVCMWSYTPSPSTFYTLKMINLENVLSTLESFASLSRYVIPTLDCSALANYDGSVGELIDVHKKLNSWYRDGWKTLLTLALCGWSLATDPRVDEMMWTRRCIKIRCQICRRSLGLWDYKPMFEEEEAGVKNSASTDTKTRASSVRGSTTDSASMDGVEKKRDKTVTIVANDSFKVSNAIGKNQSAEFLVLRPKISPPRNVAATAATTRVEDEKQKNERDKISPQISMKSSTSSSSGSKKSPEKSSPEKVASSNNNDKPASAVVSSPPSESRTRAKSQSSPSESKVAATKKGDEVTSPRQTRASLGSGGGGGGGGSQDQAGMTTRSGTIVRSPTGEPPGFNFHSRGASSTTPTTPTSAAERKKRQRSGDSNQYEGERGERLAKRVAAALASGAEEAEDGGSGGGHRRGRSQSAGGTFTAAAKSGTAAEAEANLEDAEAMTEEEVESILKVLKEEKMEYVGSTRLNPIAEHRIWCPFANVDHLFGEEEEDNLAAWNYVVRCLKAETPWGTTKPRVYMDENLSKARQLMGFL